jgi:hypothetical protein
MKRTFLKLRPAIISLIIMAFYLNSASGQVLTLKNWTSVYHGTSTSQQNINYTVPGGSGSYRVLMVAIASEKTPAGSISVTLSYGGRPLVQAAGDIGSTSIPHTALYYLDEAGLDAASNSTLSVTVSGSTIRITDVWAAVFDYVNQTAPLTDTKNYNSGSSTVTAFSFTPPLGVNAYNQAVEVMGIYNSGLNQFRTVTYAAEWAKILDQTHSYSQGILGYSMRNSLAGRNIPLSDVTDASTTTLDRSAVVSMTGLSMNYNPPPPPTVQASNVTFSNIASTSFTVKWTNGDGTNHLVIVRQGNAVTAVPTDGTTYSADNSWQAGQEIAPGNYVVYNGTSDSVNVVNLSTTTNYHVAVYEFSGPAGLEDYLTEIEPARGNVTTLNETAVNGDYRSKVTGNWGSPASWEVYQNGAWINATAAPTSLDGIITIRPGHIITVAENVTADQVVINASGQVRVNNGITFTVADNTSPSPDPVDCIVDGTLYIAGTLVPNGEFSFNTGSLYHHATNGGIIPAGTWDQGSECRITGITNTAPSGLAQSFGSFLWNCPSQSASLTVSINGNITVKGDFNLTSTGSGKVALTSQTQQVSMTVSGDYNQTGGTFVVNNSGPSTATDNIYAAGNFLFTGGTITETSTSGRGAIIFNGDGSEQMYTSGGTFQNTIDFRVEPGAFLQMGTGAIPAFITASKGTFTLSAGATLGITSPYGITRTNTNNPLGGNIRVTGTRTYNTAANYIYNGSVNQYTGDGLPSTVNSLVFNNTVGRIRFQAAHTITTSFSITSGSHANLGTYTHTTNFLSLGGQGQTSGSYGGATSPADYIIPEFFDAATGIVNNNAPAGTWLGNTSEWNLASNWVGGVPGASTNARITSAVPNQPVVSGTVNAVCNILTINSGASLTVNGTTQFSSTENNGTITINPGGKATITNVTNNGIINLESDPSAMFSFMPGHFSGTGTVNTRLFLTGGTAGEGNYRWHYLAVPSQQNKSVLTNISPNDLMWYSEPAAVNDIWEGWQWHDGYDGTTPITDLLTTTGYSFYNDVDTYVTFSGSSLLTSLPQKNLSFTRFGWNFIGNSLTCGINWDAVVLNGEVDPAVNFLKDYQEYYYIQGGPGVPAGTTGSIPPLQGFFVQANAPGASLDFSVAKEHNSTQYYKGSKEKGDSKDIYPLIRLTLGNEKLTDETVIWFNENATSGKDSKYDAEKWIPDDPRLQIFTSQQGRKYAINGLPFPESLFEVPLTLRITEDGKYTIKMSGIENMEDYAFYLKDLEQKIRINLKDNPRYSFAVAEGTIDKRFVLSIENSVQLKNNESQRSNQFNIYSSFGLLNIEPLSELWDGRTGSVKVIDLTGRTLGDYRNVEFSRSSLLQLPLGNKKGLFIVEITSSDLKHSGRVIVK